MSLIPALLQAIIRIDGDALVMHAGDKPYVISPTEQVDLASRGLTLEAVNGMVAQLLPPELANALEEFGAVQHELAPMAEFPGEHFTVVAARGGDDVWVEIRRWRIPDEDRVPDEFFAPAAPETVEAVASVPVSAPHAAADPALVEYDADELPAEILGFDSPVGETPAHASSHVTEAPGFGAAQTSDDDLELPDEAHLWPGRGASVVNIREGAKFSAQDDHDEFEINLDSDEGVDGPEPSRPIPMRPAAYAQPSPVSLVGSALPEAAGESDHAPGMAPPAASIGAASKVDALVQWAELSLDAAHGTSGAAPLAASSQALPIEPSNVIASAGTDVELNSARNEASTDAPGMASAETAAELDASGSWAEMSLDASSMPAMPVVPESEPAAAWFEMSLDTRPAGSSGEGVPGAEAESIEAGEQRPSVAAWLGGLMEASYVAEPEPARVEAERADEQAKDEAARAEAAEEARREPERRAAEEAAREAVRVAAVEEAAREAAHVAAAEEAAREAARVAAAEEAAREAARVAAAEEAAHHAVRIAAAEEAERETARIAAMAEAERESARMSAADQARREAEHAAAEERAREAARAAAAEEAEREAARARAAEDARREAERVAAEDAARESARLAAEQAAAKEAAQEAARLAAAEEAAQEAVRIAAAHEAEREAARIAAAAEAEREAARRFAADEAQREADRAEAEERVREAARAAAAAQSEQEAARAKAAEAARRESERLAAEEAAREAARATAEESAMEAARVAAAERAEREVALMASAEAAAREAARVAAAEEVQRKAGELAAETAREAARAAAEEKAREAARIAAEVGEREAARALAVEEAAREAERLAAQEEALEASRVAAQEAAIEAARAAAAEKAAQEAVLMAASEASAREAARIAAEQEQQRDAERAAAVAAAIDAARVAATEDGRREVERVAAEAAVLEVARVAAAEEAARGAARLAAVEEAAREAARQAAAREAEWEADRVAAAVRAAQEAARLADEAARREAIQVAAEEAALAAARSAAAEEAEWQAARIAAVEEAAREAERRAIADEARREAERLAAATAALEAALVTATENARREAQRLVAEVTAREAARMAAVEAANRQAALVAAAEEARREAERVKAEEAALEASRAAAAAQAEREAARIAMIEEAVREAARAAAEEQSRLDAERMAAEEAQREAARVAASAPIVELELVNPRTDAAAPPSFERWPLAASVPPAGGMEPVTFAFDASEETAATASFLGTVATAESVSSTADMTVDAPVASVEHADHSELAGASAETFSATVSVDEVTAASQVRPVPVQPAVVLNLSRNPIRSETPVPAVEDPMLSGLERLLRVSSARGASTLYLSSGSRPSVRVDGELQMLDGEPVHASRDVESLLLTLMPARSHEALRTGAATEWISHLEGVGRVRCMSFRDQRGPGGVFRLMPTRSVSADEVGLPKQMQSLAIEPEGLVLIAGTRSSGKRTTMAAFVDLMNRTRRDHIITIEREITIQHERGNSFISQREVRGNDEDLLAAVRAALREDPDVLVVEELRTGALMNLALEAAAAGRLVVGGFTAHTTTGAIDRIIDMYAPEQQRQVQMALAHAMRGVVAQVLLRKIGGGRLPAREVLLNTPAVSSAIAEGKTSQLPMAIEGGRGHGMMPLNDALVGLVRNGSVEVRDAYRHSPDRPGFLSALNRQGIDTSFVEHLANG